MHSLKKIFIVGLISLIALWLIYKLGEILYNFPGSLKKLLFLIIPRIPGLEFIAVLLAIFIAAMILGTITLSLSGFASSKIPFIGQIIKFSKTAYDLADQISKGKVQGVLVQIAPGVYRPGYTRNESLKIDNRELIKVFLPHTPNFTSGQTHLATREEIIYLPPESNKLLLKTVIWGGLLK